MMGTGLKTAALFAVYGAIGFGGDYAFAQLTDGADERHVELHQLVDVHEQEHQHMNVRFEAGDCEFTRVHEHEIDGNGLELLHISSGAGSLVVAGKAGSTIEIAEMACASEEEFLDELEIFAEVDGEIGEIQTAYPNRRNGGDDKARLDLSIRVPFGLPIRIDDSSGSIRVSQTGPLDIRDSAGSITVSAIEGDVRIDDSAGGISVEGVQGDVEIEDGSGGISVAAVSGSVALEDGSGGIDVSQVGQDVIVVSDGSGGISVIGVDGDFVVERDGSGGLYYADVAGAVEHPDRKKRRRHRHRR